MFQGIVIGLAPVCGVEDRGNLRRITVDLAGLGGAIPEGGSVAVNGTCLTSVGAEGAVHAFDVIAETLLRTNLGSLGPGDRVNIELPLRWGGEISGHLVQGHVDGTARVRERTRDGEDVRLLLECPRPLLPYLVEKGSVALDGVSLTVAGLQRDAGSFSVALIPYTLAVTTLGFRVPGDLVNLEVDHQAKLARAARAAEMEELRREVRALAARLEELERRRP